MAGMAGDLTECSSSFSLSFSESLYFENEDENEDEDVYSTDHNVIGRACRSVDRRWLLSRCFGMSN